MKLIHSLNDLSSFEPNLSSNPQLVILTGLPGSGKSQQINDFLKNHDELLENGIIEDIYIFSNDTYEAMEFVLTDFPQQHIKYENFNDLWTKMNSITRPKLILIDWEKQQKPLSDFVNDLRRTNFEIHVVELYNSGLSDQELAIRNHQGLDVDQIAKLRRSYDKLKIAS